ncbi:MAG: cytochrome c [Flavobacteriales bacterium]|nr:cytochrome c [Flavobacteriales bacterium]
MKINKIKVTTTNLMLALFGLVAVVMTSCKADPNSAGFEFMPDMYRSPSYETYLENAPYGGKDSMSARLPVAGTIPRGFERFPLSDSEEDYKLADSLKSPIEYSEELMAYGEDRYTKMCSHCHGITGDADGLVVENGGFPPPPSYISGKSGRGQKMSDLSSGKIVHTITYGYKNMGSHASQISLSDRWTIAMYVQKLAGKEFGDTTATEEASEEATEVEVVEVEETEVVEPTAEEPTPTEEENEH